MAKILTISEKLDIYDKISNDGDDKELEKLFAYIEKLEGKIKEYELCLIPLLSLYKKDNEIQ